LCWAAWNYANQSHSHFPVFLVFIALLTVPFVIYLPQAEALVFFADAILMAIAIMYGTSTCILATACVALCSLLFCQRNILLGFVFNFSCMVCGALLYSTLFHLLLPVRSSGLAEMVLPAVVMALVAFLFNASLTATTVSWKRGESISAHLIGVYAPLILNSLVAAMTAIVIVVLYRFTEYASLVIAPAIAVMWLWTTAHKTRLERAARP
jgi:hypothetical protein